MPGCIHISGVDLMFTVAMTVVVTVAVFLLGVFTGSHYDEPDDPKEGEQKT